EDNLKTIARCLNRDVEDLVVIVLERERHMRLIDDIRTAGARIKLITDGDLSPAIAAAVRGTNVHAVMGIGGAPEGVLAAAALRCLGGGMRGRLVMAKDGQAERLKKMGVTGVTDGAFMRGVRFFGGGMRTSSLLMSLGERHIRFVDTVHVDPGSDVVV